MEKNFKIICLSNAGKNKAIEDDCAKYCEKIKCEFTSPVTPQKSRVLERGFVTFYYWVHVMIAHTGLNKKPNASLCSKFKANTTKIENIMVNFH